MIYFNTREFDLYNKIIHNFLEAEVFGDPYLDIGDIIENFFPKYLYREQYAKCIKTFQELYEWTSDSFLHEMSAFHEIGLYYFLEVMSDFYNDMGEDFKKIYYNKQLQKKIDAAIKTDIKEAKESNCNDDCSASDFEYFYYDPHYFSDFVFEDLDFLSLPHFYNEQKLENPILSQRLGVNLDYYFDILPADIREKYKSNHITLTGEVSELFRYLQERITYGSLAELFWESGKPVSEKRIHIIIENMMHSYFLGKGVDISREALIKNGKVDFKLFRSDKQSEKILIEIKKASSSYLKSGYEKQLSEYIKYSGCKNAFYLIVCFTDKDYQKAQNFIRKNIYTDTVQMYINIAILDARKKDSPSVSRKVTKKD